MSETDIAWAAGIFEGEGFITWGSGGQDKKYGRPKYPVVGVSMVDSDVLRRFAAIMGGNVRGPIPPTKPHGKQPYFRWQKAGITGVEAVFEAFRPYLGERRTDRFEEVLDTAKASPAKT